MTVQIYVKKMFSWFLLVLCWYFFLVLVFQQEISHFNKLKFSISSFHGVIPALQVSLTKIPFLYLTKNTVFAMHLSPQTSPHCRFDFIIAFLYFPLISPCLFKISQPFYSPPLSCFRILLMEGFLWNDHQQHKVSFYMSTGAVYMRTEVGGGEWWSWGS